jgi:hypothetical protein
MGKIKSAMELALERTESIQADKGSAALYEQQQQGKRLANRFLDEPDCSLEAELGKLAGPVLGAVKRGVFDVLITQLTLPMYRDEGARVKRVGEGLAALVGNQQFSKAAGRIGPIIDQYFDEAGRFEEAIKAQYAPTLRQKEEELSRRLGQPVKLDPFQDPEFVAYFNQNMTALKERYQQALNQIKAAAEEIFAPA